MAKGLGLPQTKGQFKLRGIVQGMARDNALKPIKTKSKKEMKILNFGVETSPDSVVYATIQGMEKDEVFFSKRSEVKGQKGELKRVPWGNRFDDQGEGFNLIGIGVGLEKNEEGRNVTTTHTEYDAANEVYALANDGDAVFIQGEIEFSSFKNNKDEVTRNKRFAVKRIYGSNNIDFDAEDFVETSDFKQKIIFMGVEKVEDKDDPRFAIEAKIITYSSVETAEFITRNAALANQFRSNLKPYTAIEVWGKIFNKVDTDEVEETRTSTWGDEDTFKRVNKNYIRELVITGADPESIDTETYTEEIIQEAVDKMNAKGQVEKKEAAKKEDSSWGDSKVDIKEDELPW